MPAETAPAPPDASAVGRDADLYRRMRVIRRFEERLLDLFDEGVLNGTTHACIGQEADAVAVMGRLRDGDHTFSNHRCHGHFLAGGGDPVALLAEIMGKPAGVCGGKGGSQHLCAPGFKSNGIQGGIVPNAAGIAMAQQLRGEQSISVVWLGDGTFGEGVVYETLNLAALWSLPLLLVVEDNAWAQSTPRAANRAGELADRISAFGIPVRALVSTDVRELDDAAAEEIAAVRKSGPRALILETYRLCHHSKNDDNRPAEEVAARWESDPLKIQGGRLDDDARAAIDAAVEAEIERVVAAARALPERSDA